MDIEALKKKLNLSPLPMEGGYYIETYRSDETVAKSALHPRYEHDKAFCTAIYFLLTPEDFSAMHRVKSVEIFHFYAGDPAEILMLHPDGSHSTITLGSDILNGEIPQVIVPRGTWQGLRLKPTSEYALLGTTVSPAFDFDDYEHGSREELTAEYPECTDQIKALTRD